MAAIFPIASVLLASAGCAAVAEPAPPTGRASELPLPRDGNIAIRNELEAARRTGTVAAYDLFIARHPQHPLAEVARRERAALAGRPEHRTSTKR